MKHFTILAMSLLFLLTSCVNSVTEDPEFDNIESTYKEVITRAVVADAMGYWVPPIVTILNEVANAELVEFKITFYQGATPVATIADGKVMVGDEKVGKYKDDISSGFELLFFSHIPAEQIQWFDQAVIEYTLQSHGVLFPVNIATHTPVNLLASSYLMVRIKPDGNGVEYNGNVVNILSGLATIGYTVSVNDWEQAD